MKLKKLAELVGGEISGDPEVVVRRVSSLESAAVGDLVFVLENRNLAPALRSPANAVVAAKALKGKLKNKTALLVDNPRLALAKILSFLSPKPKIRPGTIHKSAVIAESAKLGKRVTIYPFVYIGEEAVIGDDAVIYPSVTIMDKVRIGRRVTIHSGARIGVDGFGFVWEENAYVKIPQTGTVVIEDDVELYANTCVARGTLGETRIGAGSKIDNLTHIAHNCVLGKNCAVTALVGFAGSVTLKDHVSVGGMAGFTGHITVGENTVILAKSGVTKDIPANSVVSGFPAINHREELELQAAIRQLPALRKKLRPGK